ncbi:MAG: hydroxymethylglutaryl-CoA lyase [Burkholderiaceae bacterium]
MRPKHAVLCDVSPRDGLQNEAKAVSTEDKIQFVNGLISAGIPRIEVTSFVSPKAIPQLADAEAVMAGIQRSEACALCVLVPNERGAERAMACRPDELNLVMSVTESHSQSNLRMSPTDSFKTLQQVIRRVEGLVRVNASLSCSFGCPFEGDVPIEQVLRWVRAFRDEGILGVSLCDTTGMAFPSQVRALVQAVQAQAPELRITLHVHDTRGLAITNMMAALDLGVEHFDACTGGIGGCPYAPGASGNASLEDFVHLLQCEGVETGIDLQRLMSVSADLPRMIGHPLHSHLSQAGPRIPFPTH